MHTAKVVISTLVVTILVVIAAVAGAIWSGVYNVSAENQHPGIVYWILKQGRIHSVASHAASIQTPPLGNKHQLLMGAANFDAMCTACHVPPGGQMTTAAKGMYPAPANLTESGAEMPAKQIFWTIKHGIQETGMPAWGSTHDAEEMWAMTALIMQFPNMSGANYQRLVQAAQAEGVGHHHHGGGEEHTEDEFHGHGSSGDTDDHGDADMGHDNGDHAMADHASQ
jgi:mono/diheme cytochrome c family protein